MRAVYVAALCLGLVAEPVRAELHAERIDEANWAARQVGGAHAVGGIDDWALGNGTVCAVVSDPTHEGVLSTQGGALIDLGHCGRGDDQWNAFRPLLNLSQAGVLPIREIRPEVGPDEARLVALGEREGLRIETAYALGRDDPAALRLVTRIRRTGPGERLFLFGDLVLHPNRTLAPFTYSSTRPADSPGFDHPAVDVGNPLVMARAMVAADRHVLVGSAELGPPISYGLSAVEAYVETVTGRRPVASVSVNGSDFTLLGIFARPLWFGGEGALGWSELVQTLFMDLGPGESLVYERVIRLARRADVASLVDTDLHGALALPRLPPSLARGRVRLPTGEPMRLVFRGVDGTEDPIFGDDGVGLRVGEELFWPSTASSDVSLAGLPSDPREVRLAPGRYRVFATRGPEYDVAVADVEIGADEIVTLRIEPPVRAVGTPGWISADLHVHSGTSFDSALPFDRRVSSFVAQGAEVLVLTEHDVIADPGPRIRELGLGGSVAGVAGAEVTGTVESAAAPFTIGHLNVFPLVPRPERYRAGLPDHEGRRLHRLLDDLRELEPRPFVQLNHPETPSRGFDVEGYFTHLAVRGSPFDPALPLTSPANRALLERGVDGGARDLDFEAMELLNGGSLDAYRRVRADWVSLLLQGERRTGTANSDSHHASRVVGLPRTYVRLADDRVAAFDEGEFVAALRGGRAFGTTGPFLRVALDDVEPGGRFRGRRGTLSVRVQAAPWVPVDRLRVYVNGDVVYRERLPGPGGWEGSLAFERDAFVTVEVWGEPGPVFRELAPGMVPLAFTNPIFVDADRDGRWEAPGLSRPLPTTISQPLD